MGPFHPKSDFLIIISASCLACKDPTVCYCQVMNYELWTSSVIPLIKNEDALMHKTLLTFPNTLSIYITTPTILKVPDLRGFYII